MKKLLLTSDGFANPAIGKKFLELAGKSADKIRIVFIPTASRTEHELKYVEKSRQELLNLGILEENIFVFNLDKMLEYKQIKNYDAIYICGGNTFYLAYKLKESGFDNVIKKFVSAGRIYVGVSAGSIVACPDIGISHPFDENDVELKSWGGLKLANIVVSPHFQRKERKIIEEYEKRTGYKVIPLNDGRALLVTGDKEEIV